MKMINSPGKSFHLRKICPSWSYCREGKIAKFMVQVEAVISELENSHSIQKLNGFQNLKQISESWLQRVTIKSVD